MKTLAGLLLLIFSMAFCNSNSDTVEIRDRYSKRSGSEIKGRRYNGSSKAAPNKVIKQEKGRVLVAFDENFPPYTFLNEKGQAKGFDVDVIREIMKRAKIPYKLIPLKWGRAVSDLKVGVVQMLLSTTITPDKKKIFLFSKSYSNFKRVIFIHKENKEIKGKTPEDLIESLFGKKVCVQTGGAAAEFFKDYKFKMKIVTEYSDRTGFRKLAEGRADAVPTDKQSGLYYIEKEKLPLKIIGMPIDISPYSTAFYKKIDPSLIHKYNIALEQMIQDGTVKRIKGKWLLR